MMWRQFLKESGRVITVFLLLVIAFCFAMFQGGFVSWFVFFTVVPFLLYAILLAFVPIQIEEIERTITPKKLSRGDRVRVDVTFRVQGKLPLLFMSVSELPMDKAFYEGARGHSTKLLIAGFKRQFHWSYELYDLQRGEHDFAGLVVVFTDFFGWTVRKKVAHKQDTFLVYPKTRPLKLQSIRAEYEQGALPSPFSLMKDTSVVTGIREYQPGDRFSWIHWKSFAKSGELRTKEFEDKQAQTIFVLLDREYSPHFERTIDFAASFLQSIVKERADVSFMSAGANRFYSPLIKTDSQLQKVATHLAVVQADAEFSVERLLQTEDQLMKRAIIVVITGSWNEKLERRVTRDMHSASKILCYVMTDEERAPQQFGRNHVVFIRPNAEVNP
ncbi:MAG: DUF58 domain-containing protein [Solibacillus sp.]